MDSKQKCISKWDKRLKKAVKSKEKYGSPFGSTCDLEIKIYTEIIKDLKRF